MCILLGAGIGFFSWFFFDFFRSGSGGVMVAIIVLIFISSKIAQVKYSGGNKRDYILGISILSDMFTIATLGLNLAVDYVEAHPLWSASAIAICSSILLLVMFMTHDGSVTNISSHDGSEGVDIKALAVKLGSDTECIKLDTQRIKKSLGDVKKTFYTLLGAIIAVALGLAGLMAKGFGWL